ncbi:tyrosine-type recombinase/integrase [Sphingopyxis sp. SE2]|uniref:tyrosine-type recombinase/integrase n=1 Tax=Sphingopyxis sp. SE2 TaxID=1586240 RepID=UPI0028C3142F|nr:tyrosine-type recombinase/integrase [Sphingopyxis sp. SE2]MDT7531227.1 tyrosine-type recombinase/integrase [Sphingopyxis sp. SE2]
MLRHLLATDLLRRGASLTEIGQLLRHSQPTTTQIYARRISPRYDPLDWLGRELHHERIAYCAQ